MRFILTLVLIVFPLAGWAAEAPRRVVVISPALTELIFLFDRGNTIVGTDDDSRFPEEVQGLPKVGSFNAISYDDIIKISPDQVYHTPEAGPPAVLQRLREAGIQPVEIPHMRSGVDNLMDTVDTLGRLYESPKKAAGVREIIEKNLNQLLQSKELSLGKPRLLFVESDSRGQLFVYGRNTAAHAMIRLAGGVNAAVFFDGKRRFIAEDAARYRADAIITTHQTLKRYGSQHAMLNAPGIEAMVAGKEGMIFAMGRDELLGFGPRVSMVAKQLHHMIRQSR